MRLAGCCSALNELKKKLWSFEEGIPFELKFWDPIVNFEKEDLPIQHYVSQGISRVVPCRWVQYVQFTISPFQRHSKLNLAIFFSKGSRKCGVTIFLIWNGNDLDQNIADVFQKFVRSNVIRRNASVVVILWFIVTDRIKPRSARFWLGNFAM